MATQRESVFLTENLIKIVKLKVEEGSHITSGQILFNFEPEDDISHHNGEAVDNGKHLNVFRATKAGVLEKLYIKEGDTVKRGYVRFSISVENIIMVTYFRSLILDCIDCMHETVMKDMCADCGVDLRKSNQRSQTAAVAMVHNIPELVVSMQV